jgi:hypothetical protein
MAECLRITFTDCSVPDFTQNPCLSGYAKTNLAPLRVTNSTAKVAVTVPRQSIFDHPYKTGWTMSFTRAGTINEVARYAIEGYDTGSELATFFIDDALRSAKKGMYLAKVMQGCCLVATIPVFLECNRATAAETIGFSSDPFAACEGELIPRQAEDCKVKCETPPQNMCCPNTTMMPCGTEQPNTFTGVAGNACTQ